METDRRGGFFSKIPEWITGDKDERLFKAAYLMGRCDLREGTPKDVSDQAYREFAAWSA